MSDSIIEKRQQRRALMLQRIYESSGGSTSKWVQFYELAESEGINRSEADAILDYLEEMGFILMPDQRAQGTITHKGVIEYEQSKVDSAHPLQHGYQTNIVHIGGNAQGLQVGGSHNIQSVTISKNDPLDGIISDIIEEIKSSSLAQDDKNEAIDSLQQIQRLSQLEKAPDVVKRAKEKLDVVQSIIKTGTELESILAPYLLVIANYFAS
jgi:hypothetical protein